MKRDYKYSFAVERYLSNDMDYAEMRSFEKEIVRNPVLALEYQLSLSINEAVMQDDILDFRKKMIDARNEVKQIKPARSVRSFFHDKLWLAAASLLILVSFGAYWVISMAGGYSNEDLFRKYYTSESIVNITRSGEANIIEALMRFQEKDYKSAENLFSQILKNDPGNYAAWFYYGISCIETENFVQAEKAFSAIIADHQSLYIEHAEWYLGLCYLKSNKLEKAKAQLVKIASSMDNYHRRDARHLLNKLNEQE